MRILKLIYYLGSFFAITILTADIASKKLPVGELKFALESAIMIIEYDIELLIYQNNVFIVGFGAILLITILLVPERKNQPEEWRPR